MTPYAVSPSPTQDPNPLAGMTGPANTDAGPLPKRERSWPPETARALASLRAGNIEEFNRLRPIGELDLREADLSGLNLRGADLRYVKLRGADLSGSDLTGASLQHADLTAADLSKTILREAKFFKANLKRASLRDVRDAFQAEFHEASLVRAELDGGNFAGAMFAKANLLSASLIDAKFSGARLEQAILANAVMTRADFSNANLSRARLFQANGQDVNFGGANLVSAEAIKSHFTSSDETADQKSPRRTSFDGAWVRGFTHNGAVASVLLANALAESLPPEGSFQTSTPPVDEKLLVHGIPGSDRIRYEKAMKELNSMIGLRSVKAWVGELVDFLIYQRARGDVGLPDLEQTLHMAYLGPPGTGKTSVARIVSELLASLGVLTKGHLVETDKEGMIAGFLGQSIGKTNELINSAIGGTLLIDEFYALLNDPNDSYSKDALAKLTKRMEDDRTRFCTIVCGYDSVTRKAIESNPGLKGRFDHFVDFPAYSLGELTDILLAKMKSKQFIATPDFIAAASMAIAAMKEVEGKDFANGRSVRNLFEKMYKGPMAARLVQNDQLKDKEALRTPLISDIPFESVVKSRRSDFPPIEKLQWIDGNGKRIGYKELPVDGPSSDRPFPELTPESIDLINRSLQRGGQAVA